MTPSGAEGRASGPLEHRWLAPAELLALAALTVADAYGAVPLSRTPFLLILGCASLRLRRRRWRDVGFTRPAGWPRALALGALAGAAMEFCITFGVQPLLARLVGKPPELSDFRPLVGNFELVLLTLVPMWVLAAFGEELAFRGYLLSRLAGLLGDGRGAWALSLLVVSLYFGWGHGTQEATGIVLESLAGLLLGLLYLASGRNLTVPIVAHGVSNTLAFVLIYFDRYPGV
jgi:membrane protease YdiL (CAAX protease family)